MHVGSDKCFQPYCVWEGKEEERVNKKTQPSCRQVPSYSRNECELNMAIPLAERAFDTEIFERGNSGKNK